MKWDKICQNSHFEIDILFSTFCSRAWQHFVWYVITLKIVSLEFIGFCSPVTIYKMTRQRRCPFKYWDIVLLTFIIWDHFYSFTLWGTNWEVSVLGLIVFFSDILEFWEIILVGKLCICFKQNYTTTWLSLTRFWSNIVRLSV